MKGTAYECVRVCIHTQQYTLWGVISLAVIPTYPHILPYQYSYTRSVHTYEGGMHTTARDHSHAEPLHTVYVSGTLRTFYHNLWGVYYN